jgi:heme oxygenase
VSIHARLKGATRRDHHRVDHSISRFNLACPVDYVAFLSINSAALASLRSRWRSADDADFNALAQSLTDDLSAMGGDHPPGLIPDPGPIDGLGLAYVVRGSRLGSKVLRKRVAPGLPTAYLDFEPTLSWRQLLQQLDDAESGGIEAGEIIIAGAQATFAVYARLADWEAGPI